MKVNLANIIIWVFAIIFVGVAMAPTIVIIVGGEKDAERRRQEILNNNPEAIDIIEINELFSGFEETQSGDQVKQLLETAILNISNEIGKKENIPIIWYDRESKLIRYDERVRYYGMNRVYNNTNVYIEKLREIEKEINENDSYYVVFSRKDNAAIRVIYIFDDTNSVRQVDVVENLEEKIEKEIENEKKSLAYQTEEDTSYGVEHEALVEFNNGFMEYDASQSGLRVINMIDYMIQNAMINRNNPELIPCLCYDDTNKCLIKYHKYSDDMDDYDDYIRELEKAKESIVEDKTYYISFEYYPNGLIRNIIIFDK